MRASICTHSHRCMHAGEWWRSGIEERALGDQWFQGWPLRLPAAPCTLLCMTMTWQQFHIAWYVCDTSLLRFPVVSALKDAYRHRWCPWSFLYIVFSFFFLSFLSLTKFLDTKSWRRGMTPLSALEEGGYYLQFMRTVFWTFFQI